MKVYYNKLFAQYIFVAYMNQQKAIMDAMILNEKSDAHNVALLMNFFQNQKLKVEKIATDTDKDGKIFVNIEGKNASGGVVNYGAFFSTQQAADDVCAFLRYLLDVK